MQRLFLSLCLLVFTNSLFAITPAEPYQTKEVLLLHSYHKGYRWTDDISKVIEENIASRGGIELTNQSQNNCYREHFVKNLNYNNKFFGFGYSTHLVRHF